MIWLLLKAVGSFIGLVLFVFLAIIIVIFLVDIIVTFANMMHGDDEDEPEEDVPD